QVAVAFAHESLALALDEAFPQPLEMPFGPLPERLQARTVLFGSGMRKDGGDVLQRVAQDRMRLSVRLGCGGRRRGGMERGNPLRELDEMLRPERAGSQHVTGERVLRKAPHLHGVLDCRIARLERRLVVAAADRDGAEIEVGRHAGVEPYL